MEDASKDAEPINTNSQHTDPDARRPREAVPQNVQEGGGCAQDDAADDAADADDSHELALAFMPGKLPNFFTGFHEKFFPPCPDEVNPSFHVCSWLTPLFCSQPRRTITNISGGSNVICSLFCSRRGLGLFEKTDLTLSRPHAIEVVCLAANQRFSIRHLTLFASSIQNVLQIEGMVVSIAHCTG